MEATQLWPLQDLIEDETIASFINGSSTYRQSCDTAEAIMSGTCPFCENGFDPRRNVVKKTLHPSQGGCIWRIWEVPYANKSNMGHHFLIVPDRHIIELSEMTPEDFALEGELVQWAIREFDLKGGATVTRYGSFAYNAGSVRHRHTNLFAPTGEGEFRFPLAKTVPKATETKVRAEIFYKLMAAHIKPDDAELLTLAENTLTKADFEFVKDRLR